MAYSDSMHFSDKISYKVLFISSYRLKDMILCKINTLAAIFLKTETKLGLFSPKQSEPRRLTAGPGQS
jgi:hypothetical protein